ncbi:MAG: carboxypeptidase regulatory-like domain-containing protein [Chloracidobacterium sp.]|nr:carboxypeptidase regulatory-like domain-containing protein [Chloracidobacterium sp.]
MRLFRFVTSLFALSGLALIGAAQQSPKTDAITGRVISDDGNPLALASVQANEAEARGPNHIPHSTTTNDEGYFSLDGLPPGDYYISASAGGYLSTAVFATERSDQPNDRYFRPGASVTVTLKKGGVITGRVTDSGGRAVVAVPLTLEYARDESGRPRKAVYVEHEGWTDDRGVYRFYGLQPGSYLVCASCRGRQDRGATAFDSDTPTYYPSSARENATEVKVAAGEEVTGVDIRYRGERGRAIRGVVAGAADFKFPPHIRLSSPGAQTRITYLNIKDQSLKFEIEGLPDGEYELTAARGVSGEDDGAGSEPRRVAIKGADINGIELRLIPFGSVHGRLILVTDSADCRIQQRKGISDIAPILYRDDAALRGFMIDRPSQQGEFAIRGVEAGRYRLAARLPHAEWFLRSITQPGLAPVNRPVDVSRQGLTLQPGERITGLIATIAEGAALLSGKVISAAEGAGLPARLRVYLIPSEPSSADDALRYVETEVESDGRFTMRHLAPGRYYLLARPATAAESPETQPRPAAWSAESRAELRREASAAKVEIELQACQRTTNYTLRYEPR